MHALRSRAAREADPSAGDDELKASNYAPCERCKGVHGSQPGGDPACGLCRGRGYVRREAADATLDGDEFPEALEPLGDFFEAWGMIEAYGLFDAAWALYGQEGRRLGWHPTFLAALRLFQSELAKHEQEQRKSDATRARDHARKAARDSSSPSRPKPRR